MLQQTHPFAGEHRDGAGRQILLRPVWRAERDLLGQRLVRVGAEELRARAGERWSAGSVPRGPRSSPRSNTAARSRRQGTRALCGELARAHPMNDAREILDGLDAALVEIGDLRASQQGMGQFDEANTTLEIDPGPMWPSHIGPRLAQAAPRQEAPHTACPSLMLSRFSPVSFWRGVSRLGSWGGGERGTWGQCSIASGTAMPGEEGARYCTRKAYASLECLYMHSLPRCDDARHGPAAEPRRGLAPRHHLASSVKVKRVAREQRTRGGWGGKGQLCSLRAQNP